MGHGSFPASPGAACCREPPPFNSLLLLCDFISVRAAALYTGATIPRFAGTDAPISAADTLRWRWHAFAGSLFSGGAFTMLPAHKFDICRRCAFYFHTSRNGVQEKGNAIASARIGCRSHATRLPPIPLQHRRGGAIDSGDGISRCPFHYAACQNAPEYIYRRLTLSSRRYSTVHATR